MVDWNHVMLDNNVYSCQKITNQEPSLDKFILTFDFAFILIAISSYSYLFIKYTQAKAAPVNVLENKQKESLCKVFRNSRFLTSFLLVSSFLVFVVLPDLVDFFIKKEQEADLEGVEHRTDEVHIDGLILCFLYHMAFICDTCTYIHST